MRRRLWRVCGLFGATGPNALRPVASASHRGPGNAYPLLLPRSLPTPSPLLTGRVTCTGASAVLSSHLSALITPNATMANILLITRLRSPIIIIQDCPCFGAHPLEEVKEEEEEEVVPLSQDKSIGCPLFTNQTARRPLRTMLLCTGLPTTRPRRATTSRPGSSGGRPCPEQ